MKLRFDARARRELIDAVDYHEAERPGLGRELEESFTDLFAEIASLPSSGAEIVPGVRARRVLRFHYTVIYQFGETEVLVLAVSHDHRRPDYWADRPVAPDEVREREPERRRPLVRVVAARYLRDYRIWLEFTDGFSGEVDLSCDLYGPVFEPLRDQSYFSQVAFSENLDTVAWPNGADFAPEFLRHRAGASVSAREQP